MLPFCYRGQRYQHYLDLMSTKLSAEILRKCSIAGKENGASKSILFEDLAGTNSTLQLEAVLEELISKGELVKRRRDRYTVSEKTQKKPRLGEVDVSLSDLEGHVKRFKADHKIILRHV